MGANKLQKRKTADPLQGNTRCVKKPTSKTSGRCNRKTGKNDYSLTTNDPAALPVTTVQMVDHQLLKEDPLFRDRKQKQEVVPNAGIPLEKMKLQLFPIDERTRVGLEKDGHNPYLELTLRARKKISSILKHLNNKWGSSSVAVGDVVLFPYNILLENLSACKRWSITDDHSCAGDVFADIGCPTLFRLRYGWFSSLDSRFIKVPSRTTLFGTPFESQGLQKSCDRIPLMDRNRQLEGSREVFKPSETSKTANAGVVANMPVNVAVGGVEEEDKNKSLTHPGVLWEYDLSNLSIGGLLSDISLLRKINYCDSKSQGMKSNSQPIPLLSSDVSIGGLLSEVSMQGKIVDNKEKPSETKPNSQLTRDNDGVVSSSVLWDDSFTTLSIGGLLSEASMQAKIDRQNQPGLQPTQLISDSLDAFNCDGLKSQTRLLKPDQVSLSSFLDAEETCHAFSFGKSSLAGKSSSFLGGGATLTNGKSIFELNTQIEFAQDHSCQVSKTGLQSHPRVYPNENSLGLGGITWTESLGPFGISNPSKRLIKTEDSVSLSKFVT